ncbi:putative kelch-type beta propeller [Dioscorea sansibarensis]
MSKMFGFSRRRMKLGRLKVQLGDPAQGGRSPARPGRRLSHSNAENAVSLSASGRSDDLSCQCAPAALDLDKCGPGSLENWAVLSIDGERPAPRSHHAAAVVGSKMVVVGGESGKGLLDDTLILNMEKLAWVVASPKAYLSPNGVSSRIPACKGHCLVSWGKVVLLIGGKTDPVSDRVQVWSFDVESECWSCIEAKGDIPAARSGHTVIRAGPVLILFGGEDTKGRKLNDLHMFDLKSLTWLPLHYTGTGPSPRSNHAATLYDDRILLVFGGQAKSKILNDLYSLDFETMVWSRIKVKGHHPSPRAGCCGALCGTKWYIAGGGSKKKRHAEMVIFDVVKLEWSVSVTSPSSSITMYRGFSLVSIHHKDKTYLVAFGGIEKEPSDQVEVLVMLCNEHSTSWRSAPDIDPLAFDNYPITSKEISRRVRSSASLYPAGRQSLASAMEQNVSGRKSLSDSPIDPNSMSGSFSLRKQFDHEEEKYKDPDDCSLQRNPPSLVDTAEILVASEEAPVKIDAENSDDDHHRQGNNSSIQPDGDHVTPLDADVRSMVLTNPSNLIQLYETRVATLIKKNASLEEQLSLSLASRETAEKNLSLVMKSKQDIERKLVGSVRETEILKEKLASLELAQEEANNLSNIVHSDNVRLEHDVAFLKAVLDDTQKELHSTRGVLAGERARAFQLQVEVFHLKQRLQTMEIRVPTPRKPFHM